LVGLAICHVVPAFGVVYDAVEGVTPFSGDEWLVEELLVTGEVKGAVFPEIIEEIL
jgi:hypothetical protein